MRIIYTLVLIMLATTVCQAQKAELILKLDAGKEYKQNTSSKATVSQEINGQTMVITMIIKGVVSYLVKTVNESDYDMDVRYQSLSMSMQMPQGNMEFNSDKKDESDVFSLILGQIIDKPFGVKMTKKGKILEVKNIESIWGSMLNKFPKLSEAQLAQMKAQLMKAYGEEAFRGNIEMVTAIFSDNSVSKGETWTINTKLEAAMSANMATVYKFLEKTDDYILIVGESTIETADKDAYIETNGMPLRYDLTGTAVSEIKIDATTGWIIEAKTNQELGGDTYIKENDKIPNGMKIPMKMINETLITNE